MSDPDEAQPRRLPIEGRPTPDTRQKILEVAEMLFAKRGFGGLGMREVARDVGIGKSTLFHHFPTKLRLYEEVLERVLKGVEAEVAATLNSRVGPADRLDLWVEALTRAVTEDPSAARLCIRALVEEDPFPPLSERDLNPPEIRLTRLIEGFQGLLEEGIAGGVFRDVPLGDATQTVIGAVVLHFASREFGEMLIGGPIFEAEAIARRTTEVKRFVRNGLLA